MGQLSTDACGNALLLCCTAWPPIFCYPSTHAYKRTITSHFHPHAHIHLTFTLISLSHARTHTSHFHTHARAHTSHFHTHSLSLSLTHIQICTYAHHHICACMHIYVHTRAHTTLAFLFNHTLSPHASALSFYLPIVINLHFLRSHIHPPSPPLSTPRYTRHYHHFSLPFPTFTAHIFACRWGFSLRISSGYLWPPATSAAARS